ncbi:Ohr family peroxiredoxin [Lysobacter enzymogenes]|uniref:Ohr family peroxiredoxin n=1 Tax=Lysobacter enzymogenes TaxID=69 RepID=A0A3N2RLN6_LYSEN|nr:Ohr family peroxiredoxin [Lysobacter enzymogenes]ROU08256.1 Ohr family peroxiredoxin [Lysobacter enzymogenes]
MAPLQAPPTRLLDKYRGEASVELYTGRVSVRGGEAGHARASGIARSDDGALAVELRLPPELGGPGGGCNPEQLLAAGYAACFHGALMLLAQRAGVALPEFAVDAAVSFARDPADGLFLLSADIRVRLPGLDRALAAELVRNTERICPYAKMFRQGIEHVVAVDCGPA